jgi:hypothetical protein
MKYVFLVLLILTSNIFSQSEKKLNEIGWENGLIYVYKGFNALNVGIKIQPNWNFEESSAESNSSLPYYYPTPTNGASSQETKFMSIGVQLSKEYQYGKYFYLEPYSIAGYLHSADEMAGPIQNNIIASYASSQKNQGNGFFVELGAKPGVILWNTVKLFTNFGIDLNFNHNETETVDVYATRKTISDTWAIYHFGDQIDYKTRLNLSVIF